MRPDYHTQIRLRCCHTCAHVSLIIEPPACFEGGDINDVTPIGNCGAYEPKEARPAATVPSYKDK